MTPDEGGLNRDDIQSPTPAAARAGCPWLPFAALLAIGLAILILWQWGDPLIALLQDQERVRARLTGFGALAPLVSIGLNVLQVLVAPVPGQVLGLANGYLFGVFWGTVYSALGVMLGSALAMGIGRRFGRPVVERLVKPDQLERWDEIAVRRGPVFFFLIFLLPLVPDDIASFVIGLSPLSIPLMLTLSAVGRLPGLIVSSWAGANASSLSLTGWALAVVGTVLLAAVVLRYLGRIETALLRFAERLSGGGSNAE